MYGFGLKQLVAPTSEPVTVADAMAHLRLRNRDTESDYLASLISVAREYIESTAGIQILPATWYLTYDQFPGLKVDDRRPIGWRYGIIRVPRPPLLSVVSVKYIDTALVLQTLATTEYQASFTSTVGRILPAPFKVWPQTSPLSAEAVQVTYTAGYADVASVPNAIKHAIKFLVGHLYENREGTIAETILREIPLGLQQMIASFTPSEYF